MKSLQTTLANKLVTLSNRRNAKCLKHSTYVKRLAKVQAEIEASDIQDRDIFLRSVQRLIEISAMYAEDGY